MAYETLLTDLRDRVLTVTMNRPDRLNAFTEKMMLEWLALLDEIDANDDVRAVVVTGAGRGFCAGADLGTGGGTIVALWPDDDAVPLERALRTAGATALYRPAPVAGFTIERA